MPKCDLLILDGRHLLWRCVHAYADLGIELEDGDWLDTGAIYGFLLLAKRAHERYGGLVVVAWEAKTNFRLRLFPNYKGRVDQANKFAEMREALARGEDPDSVDQLTRERFDLGASIEDQQKHLQSLLKIIGIRQYIGSDCEADDVMATLACGAAARNRRVVVYTGDSDLFQIVDNNITVVKPGKAGNDDLFTPKEVITKTGVRVDQIAAFKALAGDASDRIPGATGVGKKAAQKLLETFNTLAGVLEAASKDDPKWPCSKKQRETVQAQAADLLMYLQLTTVKTDVELRPRIDPAPTPNGLRERFQAYKFATFLRPSEIRGFLAMGGA